MWSWLLNQKTCSKEGIKKAHGEEAGTPLLHQALIPKNQTFDKCAALLF